jgi:hypothetical protein
MHQDLIQRIELCHRTFSMIVTRLRNFAKPVTIADVQFWISVHTAERARLMALRDTVGPTFQRLYPDSYADAVEYVQDVPTICGFMQQLVDSGAVNNARRTTLANAIEPLLENGADVIDS